MWPVFPSSVSTRRVILYRSSSSSMLMAIMVFFCYHKGKHVFDLAVHASTGFAILVSHELWCYELRGAHNALLEYFSPCSKRLKQTILGQ